MCSDNVKEEHSNGYSGYATAEYWEMKDGISVDDIRGSGASAMASTAKLSSEEGINAP